MRKLKMMVAALVCLGAMGASASRNITEEVRLAGKASFSLVQGELVSGSSLANAFDGQTGWANPCAQFVTLPTEAEPVVFDYIIADDFDDGQAFVASRIVLYGLNNYYDAARNPTFMDIYGSSDGGENWTLLYDDDWGCTFHGVGLYMNYWIPAEKRGAYRRFRFVVRGNFGSTSVTSPLAIMDIRVHQDVVWYVDPDGDDTTHSGTNGWDDAITITNAIVQGATFDEIHLKQGTHPVLKAMSHAKLFAILGGVFGRHGEPLWPRGGADVRPRRPRHGRQHFSTHVQFR